MASKTALFVMFSASMAVALTSGEMIGKETVQLLGDCMDNITATGNATYSPVQNITQKDIMLLRHFKAPVDKGARCVLNCMMQATNMTDEEGKFNLSSLKYMLEDSTADQSVKDNAMEGLKACTSKVEDQQLEKCDSAASMANCLQAFKTKFGLGQRSRREIALGYHCRWFWFWIRCNRRRRTTTTTTTTTTAPTTIAAG